MIQYTLDNSVREFLAELEKDYEIDFIPHDKEYSEIFIQGDYVELYYNPILVTSESILHELLHVELDSMISTSIGNYLFTFSRLNRKTKSIISRRLCNHVANCLEHYKMLPKFLEFGYSPETFLSDGALPKSNMSDISRISLMGIYFGYRIDNYKGQLIAIYGDPVDNDYSENIEVLKRIDFDLFNVVTKFWDEWQSLDIQNLDRVNNSEVFVYDVFLKSLEDWTARKVII